MGNRSIGTSARLVWLVLGIVIGAILVPPAAAHVGDTIAHLWGAPGHIRTKVQAFGDARYLRSGPGGVLAPGATLGGTEVGHLETGDVLLEAISFPIPLGFTPTVRLVDADPGTTNPAGCSGTAAAPKATPGHLCVYAASMNFQGLLTWSEVFDPVGATACGDTGSPCRRGVTLLLQGSGGTGGSAAAVWMVRAPT